MALVYKIVNSINGKLYVGKTSKTLAQRFRAHLSKVRNKVNRHLYDAMNHHGVEHFSIHLIEEVPDDLVDEREAFWIATLGTRSPNGYNMTEGGDGGDTLKHWSEEDKQRLWKQQAQKRMGFRHSAASKRLMGDAQRGRVRTDEQRQHLSRVLKERGHQPPDYTKWHKGQPGTRQGCPHTEATKQKLSMVRKGKTYEEIFSLEEATRLREQKKGHWTGANNPLYKDVPPPLLRQVFSLITEGVPLKEIERVTGVSPFKIRQILRPYGVTNLQVARANPNWETILKEITSHVLGSE